MADTGDHEAEATKTLQAPVETPQGAAEQMAATGFGQVYQAVQYVSPPREETVANETLKEARRRVVIDRLSLWLLFSVVFGLLPVLVNFIVAVMSPKGVSFLELFAKGDVLVSAAAISGAATGEMLFADFGERDRRRRMILGFFCLLGCVCDAVAYTRVDTSTQHTVAVVSSILLFISLVTSAICVGTAAGR